MNDILFFRGLSYLKINNVQKACIDLKRSSELGNFEAKTVLSHYCEKGE